MVLCAVYLEEKGPLLPGAILVTLVTTSLSEAPHILHNRQITEMAAQGPLDDDQTYNSGIIHPIIAKDRSQVQ